MNRTRKAIGLVIAVVVTALSASSSLAAGIFTFQQGVDGYTSAGDTYVQGDNRGVAPQTPQPNDQRLGVYERESSLNNSTRALLRFDNLTGFTGSQIQAGVSLTVTVHDNNGGTPGTWSLYAISIANAGWTPANATWDNLNQSAPTAWAGTPGLSSPGTDYVATPVASLAFDAQAAGTQLVFNLTSAGVAIVANWVDNPSQNGGFLLRLDGPQDQNRNDGIWSAEAPTLSDRPLLTVALPEPTTPALLGAGALLLARRRRTM